jgi:ribonuclease VapC
VIVLDASALIAMLKGERGTSKIAGAIANARMSVINYSEVVTHFIHSGMPERGVDAMLDPLPIEIVPAEGQHGQLAGRMRAADGICWFIARRQVLPGASAT